MSELVEKWAYVTDAHDDRFDVQINAAFQVANSQGLLEPVSPVVTPPAIDRSGRRAYFPDINGRLHAVDTSTGEPIWVKSLVYDYFAEDAANAGVNIENVYIHSRTTPVIYRDLIIFGIKAAGIPDAFSAAPTADSLSFFGTPNVETSLTLGGPVVMAVKRSSGKLAWKVRITDAPLEDGGKVTQPTGRITAPLSVHRGIVYGGVSLAVDEETIPDFIAFGGGETPQDRNTAVYNALGVPIDTEDGKWKCCGAVGSAFALDASSGELVWATPMIDTNDPNLEVGFNGWSGVSIWGGAPTIDPRRNLVYVATGNAMNAPASLAPAYDAVIEEFGPANGACQDDPVCNAELSKLLPPNVRSTSLVGMDLDTGEIRWSRPYGGLDVFSYTCGSVGVRSLFGVSFTREEGLEKCSLPYFYDGDPFEILGKRGIDFNINFGMSPMLVGSRMDPTLIAGTKRADILAFKAADVADNPGNTEDLWLEPNPGGGPVGGTSWGMASDGRLAFSQNANSLRTPIIIRGETEPRIGGFFSAHDVETGKLKWQVRDPRALDPDPEVNLRASPYGPVSLANGVLYATSMASSLYAFDAETGALLWEKSDLRGAGYAAPAIVRGVIYWPTGYGDELTFGLLPPSGLTSLDNKVYAFSLPKPSNDDDDDDDNDYNVDE